MLSTVNGLISFYDQNGNTEYFVAQSGSDLWVNGPEGTWNIITGLLNITDAQNNLASMVNLNNILYGCDRSEDQLWQWNLSGNAIQVPIGAIYSFSINNGGHGYVVGDIITVTGGSGSGAQGVVTQVTGGTDGYILTTSLGVGGSGYNNGDILSISGGIGGTITVLTVDGGGAILTYSILNPGSGYLVGNGEALTGGHGTLATLNILTTIVAGAIESAIVNTDINGFPIWGSGYVVTTSAITTGGTGNGATIEITGVTPQINGNFMANFNNTLFVNAGSSLPTALYYSDLNLGYSFNSINFLLFNTGQGNFLTGAVNALFGNLFVFKNKSIHVVTPTGSIPSYANNLYIDGIGCVSHQSIVTLPGGDIMFWDTDDIYRITGTQVLSATNHPKKGTPRLRNFFRKNVNASRLKFVCGAYYAALDVVLWFYSSPNSNSNDQCLAYHVKTQSFWPLTLRGSSCCTRVIQGETTFYSGDINGLIYQQDNGGSFNGNAISWSAQIPWQAMDGITIRKKGDLVYTIVQNLTGNNIYYDIFLNQSSLTFSANNILLSLQISSGGSQFDTAIFDTSTFAGTNTQLMEASGVINTLFKSISINFHGTCLNQPLTMYRIALTTRALQFARLTD